MATRDWNAVLRDAAFQGNNDMVRFAVEQGADDFDGATLEAHRNPHDDTILLLWHLNPDDYPLIVPDPVAPRNK